MVIVNVVRRATVHQMQLWASAASWESAGRCLSAFAGECLRDDASLLAQPIEVSFESDMGA